MGGRARIYLVIIGLVALGLWAMQPQSTVLDPPEESGEAVAEPAPKVERTPEVKAPPRPSAPDRALEQPAIEGPEHQTALSALDISGDTLASGDQAGVVALWRFKSRQRMASWVAHDGPVRRVRLIEGRLLTVGADGSVAWWTLPEGRLDTRMRLKGRKLNDGAPGQQGGVIVVADQGSVARLDQTGTRWHLPAFHAMGALAAVGGDDQIEVASAGHDGRIALWGVHTGKVRAAWTAHEGFVSALAWGGGEIASGGEDGQIHLWSLSTGQKVRSFEDHEGAVVALDLNMGLLVSGGIDGYARLHSRQSGELLAKVSHEGTLGAVVLAQDGPESQVITGAADGIMRIWSVPDLRLIATLP